MIGAGLLSAALRRCWPLLVLAAQNVATFHRHYAGRVVFPYDFVFSYHAVPYFWITSLQHRVFPEWVPFQAAGYPLALFLQSGLFYAPLHLFVLAGIPYTLHAASVLHGLHVLLGAAGAFVLLRRCGIGSGAALFGAFGYQFFGGFYANAQHVDIVRGYALLPWLFAGLQADLRPGARRTLFPLIVVPLATCLVFTGGYPGQAMASACMAFGFLAVQALWDPRARRAGARDALSRAGLMLLGVAMAAVHFVPALLLRGELVRQQATQALPRNFLGPRHLLTLFNSVEHPGLGLDPSMRSLYVTLPVVALLFFVTRARLRAAAPWLAVLAAGVLMIAGSPLYALAVRLVPPLGLSRFPAADYRFFVAFPLILAAAGAAADGARLPWRGILARLGGFLLLVVVSVPLLAMSVRGAVTMLALAGAVAAVLLARHRRPVPASATLALLLVLGAADGWRVHRDQWHTWAVDLPAWWGPTAPLLDPGEPGRELVRGIVEARLSRPERLDPEGRFPILGYLHGGYYLRDYQGGMQLRRQAGIVEQERLRQFALMPSAWLVLPADTVPEAAGFEAAVAALRAGGPDPRVEMRVYEPRGSRYRVDAAEPVLLVENESFFPGWQGSANGEAVDAVDVLGFRAWRLPPGNYVLSTRFRTPYLRRSAGVSLLAVGAWAAALVYGWGCSRGLARACPAGPSPDAAGAGEYHGLESSTRDGRA